MFGVPPRTNPAHPSDSPATSTRHRPRGGVLLVGLTAAALSAAAATAGAAHAAAPVANAATAPSAATRTVTTWAAADDMAGGQLVDVTVRNIVHTSIGGTGLRLRLSNTKGDKVVTFDSVYVGTSAGGAAVVAGTNRPVTFGGAASISIPQGATALSDPLPGSVAPQQTLAVSMHVSGESGAITAHNRAIQSTYKSVTGDHANEEGGESFGTQSSVWFWLDGLVVDAARESQTVAALGDSITAGVGTTMDANRRWPDVLADRLAQLPEARQMGVSNEGISGNRILSGVSRPGGAGDSALARLERDVLAKPGVDTILLLEGVNDIGAGSSAATIIDGYRQLVTRAHAAGRCVIGGTILPFGGSVYVDPEGEAVRVKVNDFIRTSGLFDDVVDFAAAVQDPTDPSRLDAAFFGDGLHPNDAGNATMGNSIDLDSLRCSR
jgi:lysophospholipase L1-like esterase